MNSEVENDIQMIRAALYVDLIFLAGRSVSALLVLALLVLVVMSWSSSFVTSKMECRRSFWANFLSTLAFVHYNVREFLLFKVSICWLFFKLCEAPFLADLTLR